MASTARANAAGAESRSPSCSRSGWRRSGAPTRCRGLTTMGSACDCSTVSCSRAVRVSPIRTERRAWSRRWRSALQIVYGLLSSADGVPVAIEVFAGNTGDPATVAAQVGKVKDRFGISRVVLVGDRGTLTAVWLREYIRPAGLDWITAPRAPQVKALVRDGALQLEQPCRHLPHHHRRPVHLHRIRTRGHRHLPLQRQRSRRRHRHHHRVRLHPAPPTSASGPPAPPP
jgi:hypothetical protein